MGNLTQWKLRGPVRTLRTHFAEWNAEIADWHPLKKRYVAAFRPDGQLSKSEHHNPDGSISTEVDEYDERGRRVETRWYADDVLKMRALHAYDAADRVNCELRIDGGVVVTDETRSVHHHVRFEYAYDSHGNWTERIVLLRLEPDRTQRPSNLERRTIEYYT